MIETCKSQVQGQACCFPRTQRSCDVLTALSGSDFPLVHQLQRPSLGAMLVE